MFNIYHWRNVGPKLFLQESRCTFNTKRRVSSATASFGVTYTTYFYSVYKSETTRSRTVPKVKMFTSLLR